MEEKSCKSDTHMLCKVKSSSYTFSIKKKVSLKMKSWLDEQEALKKNEASFNRNNSTAMSTKLFSGLSEIALFV